MQLERAPHRWRGSRDGALAWPGVKVAPGLRKKLERHTGGRSCPPRPRGDTGRDSREHRDGSPYHAVGEAAPLHVHGDATGAVVLLHVRLGRRRRFYFRHPRRGRRRRRQERRTPFRFRHAARGPLGQAQLGKAWLRRRSPLDRHFREVRGPPGWSSLRELKSRPFVPGQPNLFPAPVAGRLHRPPVAPSLALGRPTANRGSVRRHVVQAVFIEHFLGACKHLTSIVTTFHKLIRPKYKLSCFPRVTNEGLRLDEVRGRGSNTSF